MKPLTFLLLLVNFTIQSQDIRKFGDVSKDELKMASYLSDTSAAAVFLFDKGESIRDGLRYSFSRHVRIKILNKNGLSWANFSTIIPRLGISTTEIKGSTYNLKGESIEVTKMKTDAVLKTKLNQDNDLMVFPLPNVVVGSIVEFTYSLKGNVFFSDWTFQYPIPVILSQFETNISNLINSPRQIRGTLQLSQNIQDKSKPYELFVMRNVPAFISEPYLNNPNDYVSKIHFNIGGVSYWASIIININSSPFFGQQISGSSFLKKKVRELTDTIIKLENKMNIIYDYVKASVSWNRETDRIPDHKFKEVMEAKVGSSSEINLILVCMLRKAGLKADPVLIRSRRSGKVWSLMDQLTQFNDVICLVQTGEKKILIDATDKDLPISVLPERCLNEQGLVLSGLEFSSIKIIPSKSSEVYDCDLKLTETGELTGTLNISRSGLEGGKARKRYRDLGEEKYIDSLFKKKDWDIKSRQFDNMNETKESVKESYELEIHDRTSSAGVVMYVNPIVTERLEENIFKSEIRKYPVNLFLPFEKVFVAKILIPNNYQAEELPKAKFISLPNNGGKFAYKVTRTGNTINVTSQLTINKDVFSPEEYPALREFYNQVVAKQTEQIVLKRN
jgi:hypothetical protein